MKRLQWTKHGAGWKTKCGEYHINPTGTAGKSTRVFTLIRNTDSLALASGGLEYCKGEAESDAGQRDLPL